MKHLKYFVVAVVLIVCWCSGLSAAENKGAEQKYHGQKGDFIFDDADIKNVLLFFAKTYHFNIIIDPGISGKVNVRLIDVPWDQALDLILRTQGLACIIEWSGNEKDSNKTKKIKTIKIKKLK